MKTDASLVAVRRADLPGPDSAIVSRLVRAYLVQTEAEKAVNLSDYEGGCGDGDGGVRTELPTRYRAEVEDPERAYAGATVLLAELNGSPAGVMVVQHGADAHEIKRVWVNPSARGRHVGSALLDAALREGDRPVRLTVWKWRGSAIQLYRTRGFAIVPSWEERPGLVCMELRDPAAERVEAWPDA
ncbi:GNAT family N-acetyltransferase [Herbiconiux solani]|uniref:GNAT family N-acetyltransferase n=1 Tax=Herbiconiux solani TaxID=661329 RepID=UPI000826FD0E|nr:GNAT family N-acetyltransferase [Herbiconiux solani]